jgi:predicted nucleotidyltransferase
MKSRIKFPEPEITSFCRKNHIRRLALFGSVLRSDFRPTSDVDVLVEFEPNFRVGFIRLFEIEEELSHLAGGRKIDLVTPKFLNRRIRDRVLEEAEVQYAEG